ncbi:MAG: ATP-binding protein, partial [Anaerolineaceae bacterium]
MTTNQAEQLTEEQRAASAVFQLEDPSKYSGFEPENEASAAAFVTALAAEFRSLPAAIRAALRQAGNAGELLSEDRLQGLSELVQNADDTKATTVRVRVDRDAVVVAHNGRGLGVGDVMAMATPWLTTKAEDSEQTGRFGIGLQTLRSISTTLEVHGGPYHIEFGSRELRSIGPLGIEPLGDSHGWTTLRVPTSGEVDWQPLVSEWLDRWDSSALLFMSHVTRVEMIEGGTKL